MPDIFPKTAKLEAEKECKKIAQKAGKNLKSILKSDMAGKKVSDLVTKKVCEEIKNIDKKVVQFLVDELKKSLKKGKGDQGTASFPKATAKWKPKPPGSGLPQLKKDITEWVLDPKFNTKAKFEIRIWADPKDLMKGDKGVMLNFTVVNF